MDKDKQKFTKLQNEIFKLLVIKAGKALNQRTIAKNLKVSPTAVAKSIQLLEKEGLITIQRDKVMNLNLIKFNRDKQKAVRLKRLENIKLVYESGLIDFLEDKFPGSGIILFGSYSLGEDTTSSDLDIAIIGAKDKEINLTKFDRILERTIFLHFYKSLKEINNNLKSNILNGITLSGIVEL